MRVNFPPLKKVDSEFGDDYEDYMDMAKNDKENRKVTTQKSEADEINNKEASTIKDIEAPETDDYENKISPVQDSKLAESAELDREKSAKEILNPKNKNAKQANSKEMQMNKINEENPESINDEISEFEAEEYYSDEDDNAAEFEETTTETGDEYPEEDRNMRKITIRRNKKKRM